MKPSLLLITVMAASYGMTQVADTETLSGNSVSATIADEGFFFDNSESSAQSYNVPNGGAAGTFFVAGIWAGGLDANNQLHLTAPSNSEVAWRSGPIADNTSYGSSAYVSTYGKSIWKVTRQEVNDHIAQFQQSGYSPVSAIADWPGNGDISLGVANQLAPFVDQDGDGLYEPLDGDYPDFPGDQVVYVIQNDESYLPQPSRLGVELHLMFYQFNDNGYMGETTFMNARVFNRSSVNYADFKLSIYADFDIGNYADDYFGSSVTNNMMYAYNGDSYDETNGAAVGYENNPPCQAITSLNHDLHSVHHFLSFGQFPLGPPSTNVEHWNFMNGLWADGSSIFYGGNGYNAGVTTIPTKFIYPGDSDPMGIATGGAIINDDWGEYNADGGSPNPPNERRGLLSISPGDLLAGSVICSDFAFLFNEDDPNPRDNVDNVENIATALKILYDNSSVFPCGNFMASLPEENPIDFNVYPNPSQGDVTVQINNFADPIIIEVRDMTGRLVHSEVTQSATTSIHLNVPEGMYQLSVQSAHSKSARSFVIH